jgi:hypothetical protein
MALSTDLTEADISIRRRELHSRGHPQPAFIASLCGGLLVTLLGGIYFVLATALRTSSLDDGVGSDGIPRIYGCLLALLGLLVCIQALVKRFAAGCRKDQLIGQSASRVIYWRSGLLILLIAAYIALVDSTGYGPGITLVIFFAAMINGGRANLKLLGFSVAGAAVLYLLFTELLGISMPGFIPDFSPGSWGGS